FRSDLRPGRHRCRGARAGAGGRAAGGAVPVPGRRDRVAAGTLLRRGAGARDGVRAVPPGDPLLGGLSRRRVPRERGPDLHPDRRARGAEVAEGHSHREQGCGDPRARDRIPPQDRALSREARVPRPVGEAARGLAEGPQGPRRARLSRARSGRLMTSIPIRAAASVWLIVTVLAAAGAPSPAAAQDGSVSTGSGGALFLRLPVGARAVALGRVMTTVESSEAAFWNPAGLAGVDKNEIVLFRGDHVAGTATALTGVWGSSDAGSLGLSYFLLDAGEL